MTRGEVSTLGDEIDRSSPVPLYHQLERLLRDAIGRGVYRPGEVLPSENEICERYDVSRSVVRQTLANLAHAGLVHTERGRGSFVAEPKLHERFVQRATGFYDDLTRMGLDIKTDVIRQEITELPLQVREFLRTERGVRIDRVRSVEGRVLAYVTTYLPDDRAPGIEKQDLTDRSLYEHLATTYGLRVHAGRRTVEAVAAADDVAGHLGVEPGTPLLLLRSASSAEDGEPLEWFEAWHRADRTMFELELLPGEPSRPFHGVVRGASARREQPRRDAVALDVLRRDRIVAVLRAGHYRHPRRLAQALRDGGITVVEFTLTGANALEAVHEASGLDGVIVGAGSVLDPGHALAALDAGARFVVAPVGATEVAAAVDTVPVVLAGLTPTEVWTAWRCTRVPVKLYPASAHGPAYLHTLLGPMPELELMPSGGVGASNAQAYLDAGAVAVNVGGALCPPALLESGDAAGLSERARTLREHVPLAKDGS